MFKNVFTIVLLSSLPFFANSLQDDIAKLRSAPSNERYKIMNKIKLQLSKMNEKQRAQIVQKLFKVVKSKQHTNHNFKHIMNKKEKAILKKMHLDKNYHNKMYNKNEIMKNKDQSLTSKFKENKYIQKHHDKNKNHMMHKDR